jgi:hypothetical protein
VTVSGLAAAKQVLAKQVLAKAKDHDRIIRKVRGGRGPVSIWKTSGQSRRWCLGFTLIVALSDFRQLDKDPR